MRKPLMIAVYVILAALAYTTYRATEENRVVRGVTITVQTPDRIPIPHTIIQLKTMDGKVTIQSQTDKTGKLTFQKLTPGAYHIRATQVWCDGETTGARVITITIWGSNNLINYSPCG